MQPSHYHCMFRDLKSFAHAKNIFIRENVQIKRKLSDITDALEYKMRKSLFLEWILWSAEFFSLLAEFSKTWGNFKVEK